MNAKRFAGCAFAVSALFASASAVHAQSELPESVQVPEGHEVTMETRGVGEITYECRDKAGATGETEWVFVGPKAVLNDRSGQRVGDYFGPPATWQSTDGSKITGTQVAVAPAGEGNIPYQLVKANPAEGDGAMKGVSYIQRVATQGGVAPSSACTAAEKGSQEVVNYEADYLFWAAK